jgi:hypothetical protein
MHAAACGAAVVVNDIDDQPADEVVSLIEVSGGRAVTSVGSVADPDQAHAAIRRYQASVWEDTPERMRELIDVNVLGSLYCGSAADRHADTRAPGGDTGADRADRDVSTQRPLLGRDRPVDPLHREQDAHRAPDVGQGTRPAQRRLGCSRPHLATGKSSILGERHSVG